MEREVRARRLATRVSLAATALTIGFFLLQPVRDPLGRVYAAVAIFAMLVLTRRIAIRVAMEFLPPVLLAAALGATALGAGPLAAQPAPTSITIGTDGRVLVRRSIPVAVPAGESVQRLALGRVEPGSLVALDDGVLVLEARHDPGADEAAALRAAIGTRVAFVVERQASRETGSAVLLGIDPERWRLDDGTISFARPGLLRFAPELVPAEPVTQLRIRSASARAALRLAWLAPGPGWSAAYTLVAGARSGRLSGGAVLPASAFEVKDAEVQLLAGETRAPTVPRAFKAMNAAAPAMALQEIVPAEEAVGDAHLYSLGGRWSFAAGVPVALALFEPFEAPVEKRYTVRATGGYGPVGGGEEGQRLPVEVRYDVTRVRGTAGGDRPLPAGLVRVLVPDSAGRLQLVGEGAIGHTAAGQPLRVVTGAAFDLTARRVETSYTQRRDSASTRGARMTLIASYRVMLANAGDAAATIDVVEQRPGEWTVTQGSVPAEKLSSTEQRFRVTVPARGEALLTYTVRASW